MSLLFADGFDLYDNAADVYGGNTRWTAVGSPSFTKTGGRFGGGGLILSQTNPANTGWGLTIGNGVAAATPLYCSFALKLGGLPNAGSPSSAWIVQFWDNLTSFLGGVFLTPTGTLQIVNSPNSTVATSSFVLNVGVWYWVEIKWVQGTSNSNGSAEIRVNGAVIATASSIDTFVASGRTLNYMLFGPGSKTTTDVLDDIVINDDAGSVNNGYPGDCRIDTQRPTGDGTTVNWTSSSGTTHNDVDDPNGSSDGDSSYISSNTVGQVSRVTNSALVGTSTSILGVVVRSKAKKTDAGARTYNNELKSGGSTVDATAFDPGIAYSWSPGLGDNILELNPNGSVAWTDSAVNAVEVGVKLAS